jgi:CheY-like chemotaxis protein
MAADCRGQSAPDYWAPVFRKNDATTKRWSGQRDSEIALAALEGGTLGRRVRHAAREDRVHALIIEDDYLIAREIEDQLRDLGFRTFSFARSEDTAVAAAQDRRPDLITADVRLLPGSGIAAVAAIRSTQCPVIFITGYPPDVESALPDALILRKPFNAAELKEAVERVLPRNPQAA